MENQEKKVWIKPELFVDDIQGTADFIKFPNTWPEAVTWHSGGLG